VSHASAGSGATYGQKPNSDASAVRNSWHRSTILHTESREQQRLHDQFEFPDIPCAYPVVWVKAKEPPSCVRPRASGCAMRTNGKAHADGRLEAPDYPFELAKGVASRGRDTQHANWLTIVQYAPSQRWSYGATYQRGICATGARRAWIVTAEAGPSADPTPTLRDHFRPVTARSCIRLNGQCGRAYEPSIAPDQNVNRGSKTLGYTEMKGSWFIFDTYRAHEDWCRWRAPFCGTVRVVGVRQPRQLSLGVSLLQHAQ